MIFFTSDHHFSHENIIKYMNRPFESIDDMDEALIDNHNSVVKKNDTVYFLGDFCFNSKKFEENMKKLNGIKHFISGNHDPKNLNKFKHLFASISQIKQIKIEEQRIVLCHYAMRRWNGKHHGYYHLFGHSHGLLPIENFKKDSVSFDIGVDAWNYFPVSWDQCKAFIEKNLRKE